MKNHLSWAINDTRAIFCLKINVGAKIQVKHKEKAKNKTVGNLSRETTVGKDRENAAKCIRGGVHTTAFVWFVRLFFWLRQIGGRRDARHRVTPSASWLQSGIKKAGRRASDGAAHWQPGIAIQHYFCGRRCLTPPVHPLLPTRAFPSYRPPLGREGGGI